MSTKDRLRYEDLQLGERAVREYQQGTNPLTIAETMPTYLNTREAYRGLTTTDLVSAAVLGGVNGFLMGKKGTGKSQLAEDLTRHYFGGKINSGGEGFITEAHNDFELEPLFVRFNTTTGEKELKGTHDAVFYVLEELTRAHAAVQNQFYSFGNGRLIINGFDERLGREGYSCALATGNDTRNQKNVGTFESDEALLSRFAFVLDLNDKYFRLTDEDRFWIEHVRPATPGLTLAKKGKNLTDRIIQAHKEIKLKSTDLGLETEAVFAYLGGLRTCPGMITSSGTSQPQDKEDIAWPYVCMSDCQRTASETRAGKLGNSPLCHLIKAPDTRVLNASRKYTAALDYLTKLKNPKKQVSETDLAFISFELTGAYQNLLNESVLDRDFENRNNTMMREVCNALREDYETKKDYICQTLARARNEERTEFFLTHRENNYPVNREEVKKYTEQKRKIQEYIDEGGDASELPSGLKDMKVVSDTEIFTDKREVPLKTIARQRDLLIANKQTLDKHQKQGAN
ncbi:MAG: AAA family ATPase [Nanoarchaeota archaeon]